MKPRKVLVVDDSKLLHRMFEMMLRQYPIVHAYDGREALERLAEAEHKDVDRFRGQPAEDTGITSVFLGPRVIAAFGKISAEIAVDLPVSIDNTALQVVPDYRIRSGIAIRF